MKEAKESIEEWGGYNDRRPHSALNNLTPREFMEQKKRKTADQVNTK